MGNPTANITPKHYTVTEKRGKNTTEAYAGKCGYEKNEGIDPQATPVSKYTVTQKEGSRPNPAKTGTISNASVASHRKDPRKAGVKKVREGR